MFVCPFPTDQKYWKIKVSFFFFFSFSILHFYTKMLNRNVRIHGAVPKSTLTRYYGIKPPPTPGLNQFWNAAYPWIHTHTHTPPPTQISPMSRIKNQSTDPSDFVTKRINKLLLMRPKLNKQISKNIKNLSGTDAITHKVTHYFN